MLLLSFRLLSRNILKPNTVHPFALLLLLTAMASSLRAQPKNDSLVATFAGVQDDSVRVDSMLKIVFKLGATDPMLGIWLTEHAEALPWSHDHPWVRARAHNLRGIIYFNLKITDLAMVNLLQAARISDSFGLERTRVNAMNNIGTIQENEGRFEEALKSYRSARAGYLKLGGKANAVMALTNVALVYMDLKQYDRALAVCDSALKEIENPEDANAHARVYGLMGEIFMAQKDYSRALQMLNQSIDLAEKGEDDHARAEDLIIRAEVKHQLGMEESALEDLRLALKMERELGVLPFVVDCYNLFAKIAKQQGDFSQSAGLDGKEQSPTDSIHSEESTTALANYQTVYDVEQKDAKIDLLNKDKEIQETKLLNVWYLFGLVSVALIAMLVILVVLFRNNKARRRINLELQDKNAQIIRQNAQISQQNSALTTQNEQLNILNHEMSGLLHVVAHDLKAPLNQVANLIEVAEEDGNLNPNQEKVLSMAKKVTNNAWNLVKDLIELGRAEHKDAQLKMAPVPLGSLITEVAATFSVDAAKKSIEIQTALPEVEAYCVTEPSHLRRVLENLISNALKFSPSGKTVEISLASVGQKMRITVRDQGPGISPEDQKNLYRKFHKLSARPTAGESSSGLGLAIVKTLVDQLGGEITVESEVGVGSTFVVRIPNS
ncbi:MAG: tetratricopeptide repeat-containing sensor histidine kinase [Bacteroidia bacterium]